MDSNILAVDTATYSTYDFLLDGETKDELLNRANTSKKRDIARFNEIITDFKAEGKDTSYYEERLASTKKIKYRVMTWDEFQAGQKKFLLSDELQEITEEQFEKALNVLPPLMWYTINGVEMFCMSEMYTDTYTTQYAKCNGNYYCKMVDIADKSTWINNLLTPA